MSRFFVPTDHIDFGRGIITVDGTDVRHLKNVLRAAPGTPLTLCDSAGTEYACVVETVEEDRILCRIEDRTENAAEPRVPVVLLQGLPKGDKADLIVQKCVELGITGIVPVLTERTVVRLESKSDGEKKRARWQRIAMEAAKQCGRGIVPQVGEVTDFAGAVALAAADGDALKIIPYENEQDRTLKSLLREQGDTVRKIYLLIGPEGGFSREEVRKAQDAGFTSVTLGKRILRTETAGFAALAGIRYELGD